MFGIFDRNDEMLLEPESFILLPSEILAENEPFPIAQAELNTIAKTIHRFEAFSKIGSYDEYEAYKGISNKSTLVYRAQDQTAIMRSIERMKMSRACLLALSLDRNTVLELTKPNANSSELINNIIWAQPIKHKSDIQHPNSIIMNPEYKLPKKYHLPANVAEVVRSLQCDQKSNT